MTRHDVTLQYWSKNAQVSEKHDPTSRKETSKNLQVPSSIFSKLQRGVPDMLTIPVVL